MSRRRKYPEPIGEVRGYHMTEDEAAVKLIDILLLAELQPIEYDSSKNHRHHINPKRAMDGTDDPSNLVILEHREHVEIHFALAFYFDVPKLWVACNMMVGHPVYARVVPVEARVAMAATAASKHGAFISEAITGQNNGMFGRGYLIAGERNSMSLENPNSAEARAKIALARTGISLSAETKKKLVGRKNGVSLQNPNSAAARAKIAATHLGRKFSLEERIKRMKNPIRAATVSKLMAACGLEVAQVHPNYRKITDPVSGASIRIKATRLDVPGAAEEILAELRGQKVA